MKSALLAAIFGITGGVAILLAVPAPALKIHLPKRMPDYDEPMVPQIEEVEEEVGVPEPWYPHFQSPKAKTEKPTLRRHMHVVRPRPNLFEKLVAGFIKLQRHQPAKSFCKRSRKTSQHG